MGLSRLMRRGARFMLLVAPIVLAESEAVAVHEEDVPRILAAASQAEVKLRLAARLTLNMNANLRYVVGGKCRIDGENDLSRIASRNASEEAYIFVPSRCLWIEAGIEETPNSVRIDAALVHELFKIYDSMVLYHVHPGVRPDVRNYFPAYRDLLALASLNGRYWNSDEKRLVHRIVNRFGIVEYNFSSIEKVDAYVGRLIDTGLGDYIPENLAFEFLRQRYRDDYIDKVDECSSLASENDAWFELCFPLNTLAFTLSFRLQGIP